MALGEVGCSWEIPSKPHGIHEGCGAKIFARPHEYEPVVSYFGAMGILEHLRPQHIITTGKEYAQASRFALMDLNTRRTKVKERRQYHVFVPFYREGPCPLAQRG